MRRHGQEQWVATLPAHSLENGLTGNRAIPALSLLVAVVALAMVYRPAQLLGDPDTYLHIAAGNWMLEHKALPSHDPFSWSMAGARWVVHEWLAEIVMAVVQRWLGWAGLALATALSFALAMGLLARAVLTRLAPLPGVLVVFLSIMLMEWHLLARPHAIALPAMVAWCAALFAARDARRGPPWTLLPTLVLWANMHGAYMFGLALAVYLAAEAVYDPGDVCRPGELKRWGLFVLAAVACTLLNPNGLDGVLEPFRISAMPTLQSAFIEWRSPDFQRFRPLELWLLGLLLAGFSTGIRLPLPRLLLLIGLFHLALQHERHADLLAVVAPLALAAPLSSRVNAMVGPQDGTSLTGRVTAILSGRGARYAVAGLLAIIGVFSLIAVSHPIARANGPVTPSAALAAARSEALTGPVFNSERFGGFLIFSGVKVFIDGRMELYGDDFLKRDIMLVDGRDPAALKALLDQGGVIWTMLTPEDRAVDALDHDPGWRRVYADQFAVVHARISPAG